MSDLSCNLKNHFLIAMPQLHDANFSKTLIYICDHDEQGALGLIINQPMQLELADICSQLDVDLVANNQPIHAGGPVETERGFVLHTADARWQDFAKKIPALLRHQLLAKLFVQRWSLSRSFNMPVGELERLTGNQQCRLDDILQFGIGLAHYAAALRWMGPNGSC